MLQHRNILHAQKQRGEQRELGFGRQGQSFHTSSAMCAAEGVALFLGGLTKLTDNASGLGAPRTKNGRSVLTSDTLSLHWLTHQSPYHHASYHPALAYSTITAPLCLISSCTGLLNNHRTIMPHIIPHWPTQQSPHHYA